MRIKEMAKIKIAQLIEQRAKTTSKEEKEKLTLDITRLRSVR